MPIGCGLEPETAEKYKQEWAKYVRFCQSRGVHAVPGRDVPWRIVEVAQYLQYRANTNNVRTLTQIK